MWSLTACWSTCPYFSSSTGISPSHWFYVQHCLIKLSNPASDSSSCFKYLGSIVAYGIPRLWSLDVITFSIILATPSGEEVYENIEVDIHYISASSLEKNLFFVPLLQFLNHSKSGILLYLVQ
jgi:hypothetical protein